MSVLPGVERILIVLLCLYWSYRLFTAAANKARQPDPEMRHFLMPPAAGFALAGAALLAGRAGSWHSPEPGHRFRVALNRQRTHPAPCLAFQWHP